MACSSCTNSSYSLRRNVSLAPRMVQECFYSTDQLVHILSIVTSKQEIALVKSAINLTGKNCNLHNRIKQIVDAYEINF